MTRTKWLMLVNRIAGCLGVGALFVPIAQADAAPASAPDTVHSAQAETGGVLIRLEDDQVFISENGRPFERLDLKDGAEADHLRALLRDAGGAAAPVHVDIGRSVVADGAAAWHRP